MMVKIWDRQFFLTLVGSFAFLCLLTAFIAEYGFKILPCSLCLYERYVYASLAILGFISAFRFSPALFYFAGFVALSGLGLALYHLGVELHWWQAPHACHSAPISADNFRDFQAQFMKKAPVHCDQISWVLLGVSATIWNAVFFSSVVLSFLIVKFKSRR